MTQKRCCASRFADFKAMKLVAVLVVAVLFYSAPCSAQCDRPGNDLIRDPQSGGRDVVITTADEIQRSGIFDNDFDFLLRMAAVESNYGVSTALGVGGIWRIHQFDVFFGVDQYMKMQTQLEHDLQENFCFLWTIDIRYSSMNAPLYSALTVMLYLRQIGETIPSDAESQADLWIRAFNKNGDRQEFISISRSIRGTSYFIKTH